MLKKDDIRRTTVDIINLFLQGCTSAEICNKLNIDEAGLKSCLELTIEQIEATDKDNALAKENEILKDTIALLNERIRTLENNCQKNQCKIIGIPKGSIKITLEQMQILQMDIEETDLKRKFKNGMAENDIKTVKEMSEYSLARLMNLKKVGKTLADEARMFLKRYGLKLGASYYTDMDGQLYMS